MGQHLRQPGLAHQHLRRHRALRGPRRGAEPGAWARPAAVRRADRAVAGRGHELEPAVGRRRVAATTPASSTSTTGVDRARRAACRSAGRTRAWAGSPNSSARCCRGQSDGTRCAAWRRRRSCDSRSAVVVLGAGVVVGVEVTQGRRRPIRSTSSTRARRACSPGPPSTCSASRSGPSPTCRTWATQVDVVMPVRAGHQDPAVAPSPRSWRPSCSAHPTSTSTPATPAGLSLAAGDTIPEDHTTVPVSTDELLKELQHTLNALNPHAVGNLVTNLATDLDGQGAEPQQADRLGGGDRAAAGEQGRRPRPARTARWPS